MSLKKVIIVLLHLQNLRIFSENSVDKNSTEKTSVNSFENSNEEKKNLSSQLNIETVDYPDSSDFSDDEDDE